MRKQDSVIFNLAVPASAGFAPVILAKALGYDRDEGLDIEFRVLNSPSKSISGVAAGDADMTYVNSWFGFGMRDRGLPVKAFYNLARGCVRFFVTPNESAIQSVRDLRGKRVAADVPDLIILARAALADEGLDEERDVTFVPHALSFPGHPLTSDQLEPIQRGDFDALWIMDIDYPILTEQGLSLRRLPSKTLDALTPGECIYTNEEVLGRRPHVVAGVGRAIAKATVFSMANPQAAIRLFWKATGTNKASAEDNSVRMRYDLASLIGRLANMRLDIGTIPLWGAIAESEANAWGDYLFRNGAISTVPRASEFFTAELVSSYNDFDKEPITQTALSYTDE